MAAKLWEGDTVAMQGEVTIVHDDGSVTVRLLGYSVPSAKAAFRRGISGAAVTFDFPSASSGSRLLSARPAPVAGTGGRAALFPPERKVDRTAPEGAAAGRARSKRLQPVKPCPRFLDSRCSPRGRFMPNAKVLINEQLGTVELEGEDLFVRTYLDILIPIIEAGLAEHQTRQRRLQTPWGRVLSRPNKGPARRRFFYPTTRHQRHRQRTEHLWPS